MGMHQQGAVRSGAVLPRATRAALLGVAGLVGGVAALLLTYSGRLWLLDLASWPALYLGVYVLLVQVPASPRRAAGSAVITFVPFVLGYYGAMFERFGTAPLTYGLVWLVGAVALGPIAAAARVAFRNGGAAAVIASAVLASGALADRSVALLVQHPLADAQAHVVQMVVDVAVAAFVLVVASPSWRVRGVAAALTLPLSVVVMHLAHVVHYGIAGR